MSRWWRAYDEAVDNPKLIMLSDRAHRAWFNLMCIASANGGRLPAMKIIAVKLRMSRERAEMFVLDLSDAGLIDKDETGFRPHNWDARQFKSDVSTPRVKRFREQQRNVSVTPPETEAETERKKESCAVAVATRPPNDAFERFWNAYPKRLGANPKHPAAKLFLAATKAGAEVEEVIAGARRFAESPSTKIGTEFVPQAVKWLRDKRWQDYPATTGEGLNGHAAGHWIAMDTPEWDAWSRHRGKPFALDKRGGWTAPSQWPPGFELQREPECSIANPPFGIGED